MIEYPSKLRLSPIGPVNAIVKLPGSKSITNRAYLISALADGVTTLSNPLHSEDTEAMETCLSHLGVHVDTASTEQTVITGCSGMFSAPSEVLFSGNSGTTIRFLTASAALTPAKTTVELDGVARMRQRPIRDLIEAMQQLGVKATTAASGCPPVKVSGGGMYGGQTLVKGSISSQYLSALLLAAPYAQTEVTILVDGELVSQPYVDMTINMMRTFGVEVFQQGYAVFIIPGNQVYRARNYAIEPDASNASYFLAAAAVTGGHVTVDGLGTTSIQGDIAFIDVLETMGCTVRKTTDTLTMHGSATMHGIEFDASRIPDMAQTIAVAALFASGPTHLTGLKTLRVKETDRIHALAVELRKLGADVIEGDDFLTITPPTEPRAAQIETYDDHRMAMSFAIAGLRIPGMSINDPRCVSKTFPDFWIRWERAFPKSVVGN